MSHAHHHQENPARQSHVQVGSQGQEAASPQESPAQVAGQEDRDVVRHALGVGRGGSRSQASSDRPR